MRVGRDGRADVLDCEPDRPRLERRQLGRPAEHVAVKLLVDADAAGVLVELGVDGVAAAAEVDEVEQREVVLELLGGDREAVRELGSVEVGVAAVTTGGEQVGEQRLQQPEPLRCDRAGWPLGGVRPSIGSPFAPGRGWRALVRLAELPETLRDGVA